MAGSSHQDGKADAVADFIASCKKCGVKPRLYFYYSTSCNGYYGIDHAKTCDYRSPDYQKYVKMVEGQLKEIRGNYGERVRGFSVWIRTEEGEEKLFAAHCIGHKRIVSVNRRILGAELRITKAVKEPVIRDMPLYR